MTNKSSQEIMNGCEREYKDKIFQYGQEIVLTLECNKKGLCPICQAQRQEKLECYNKELEFLEKLQIAGYNNLDCDDILIKERISFLKSEIKILKGAEKDENTK